MRRCSRRPVVGYVATCDLLGGWLTPNRKCHVDSPVQPTAWVASSAGGRVSATGLERLEALRPASAGHRLHRDLRRAAEGPHRRNPCREADLGHILAHERLRDRPLESRLAVAPAARRGHAIGSTWRKIGIARAESDRANIPEGGLFAAAALLVHVKPRRCSVVSIDAREDRSLRWRRTSSARRDRASPRARAPRGRRRQELRRARTCRR